MASDRPGMSLDQKKAILRKNSWWNKVIGRGQDRNKVLLDSMATGSMSASMSQARDELQRNGEIPLMVSVKLDSIDQMSRVDKQVYLAYDKQETQKRRKRKKIKFQIFILLLACLRFYLLGMLELNSQINAITGSHQNDSSLLTGCFSFLIFGQVLDNYKRYKNLWLGVEIALVISFLIMGCAELRDYTLVTNNPTKYIDGDWLLWSDYLMPMNFFLISSYQMLQLIQIFNWFQKRRLGTVIGIWMLVQNLGLYTRFGFQSGLYQYFPSLDQAEKNDYQIFQVNGYIYFSVAVCFFVITIVDYKAFIFHPFEKNIVVDLDDMNEHDRQLLIRVAESDHDLINYGGSLIRQNRISGIQTASITQSEVTFGRESSTLSTTQNNRFRGSGRTMRHSTFISSYKANSYMKVFKINEFVRLMISGFIFQVAVNMALLTSENVSHGEELIDSHRKQYEYGATLATAMLGILTDVLLKGGYLFTLTTVLIISVIAYTIINATISFATDDNVLIPADLNFWFFGYAEGLIYLLQCQLIPLIIAAKYRDFNSPWELPLVGQILAAATVFILVAPVPLAESFAIVIVDNLILKGKNSGWTKLIVASIEMISIIPLYKMLKEETRRVNDDSFGNPRSGVFTLTQAREVNGSHYYSSYGKRTSSEDTE